MSYTRIAGDALYNLLAREVGELTCRGPYTLRGYFRAAEHNARAVNVATRGSVGTGSNILIAGFNVSGAVSRRVLIRGAGPAATAVWAATSPLLEGHGGAYCQDCDIAGPATSDDMLIGGVKPWAVDPAAAARLWELSAELTGLDAFA